MHVQGNNVGQAYNRYVIKSTKLVTIGLNPYSPLMRWHHNEPNIKWGHLSTCRYV